MSRHAEYLMIDAQHAHLSSAQLRAKVREYPWAKARIAECQAKDEELGLKGILPVSEEDLIDRRLKALIGKMVDKSITGEEQCEYDELTSIRTQLMMPRTLRRR